MTPQQLRARTKKFAIDVIHFCIALPAKDAERVIGRQLLRAGTSVGGNYRAVCRARTDREFIAKLGLTIEEADESAYWMEILVESGLLTPAVTESLHKEAEELTRILVASRETVRRNQPKSRRRSRQGAAVP